MIAIDTLTATATFTPMFTLLIGQSNAGTGTGLPAGVLSTQINGGSSCAAKFTQGTTVTLTAISPTGTSCVTWTRSGAGACSLSTNPICNTTSTSTDLSIQARFRQWSLSVVNWGGAKILT